MSYVVVGWLRLGALQLVDVTVVELRFARAAHLRELIDEAFERAHAHVLLIGTQQELTRLVGRVGFHIRLGLADGDDSGDHTEPHPEQTFEHHSPLASSTTTAALLAWFLCRNDCAVTFIA